MVKNEWQMNQGKQKKFFLGGLMVDGCIDSAESLSSSIVLRPFKSPDKLHDWMVANHRKSMQKSSNPKLLGGQYMQRCVHPTMSESTGPIRQLKKAPLQMNVLLAAFRSPAWHRKGRIARHHRPGEKCQPLKLLGAFVAALCEEKEMP